MTLSIGRPVENCLTCKYEPSWTYDGNSKYGSCVKDDEPILFYDDTFYVDSSGDDPCEMVKCKSYFNLNVWLSQLSNT